MPALAVSLQDSRRIPPKHAHTQGTASVDDGRISRIPKHDSPPRNPRRVDSVRFIQSCLSRVILPPSIPATSENTPAVASSPPPGAAGVGIPPPSCTTRPTLTHTHLLFPQNQPPTVHSEDWRGMVRGCVWQPLLDLLLAWRPHLVSVLVLLLLPCRVKVCKICRIIPIALRREL